MEGLSGVRLGVWRGEVGWGRAVDTRPRMIVSNWAAAAL